MSTITVAKPIEIGKTALILIALAAPFFLYFSTASSIVTIWNSSETFAHGYIILPISLWLIWRRRTSLLAMSITPFWPGLALLALCGFGWMLAELGDVQVVRQYCFVIMIPLTVLVVLGWRISWAMLFPLCFLLFAVPFGDVFIEPLIQFTVNFTINALQLTGIPVLRNGSSFSIPTGNWSVVEACSGVRYLISSITLGCLYAYLTYRSWKKQLVFVIMAIITPVIANGLRAYMIVMLGHLSGMTLAVGVDHLIYGWLFFGLVIFIMFTIGSYWRDDGVEGESHLPARFQSHPPQTASTAQVATVVAAVLICLAIWPLYANYLVRANHNPVSANLTNFTSDWQLTGSVSDWRPDYLPASTELDRSYAKQDQHVNLLIKYYRNQTHDASVISSNNRMVLDNDERWTKMSTEGRNESIATAKSGTTENIAVRETQIRTRAGNLLVWSRNWINGQFISSNYYGKVLQTRDKLRLAGDDGAAVILSAPYSENPEEARVILRSFLTTNLDGITATLDANRKP